MEADKGYYQKLSYNAVEVICWKKNNAWDKNYKEISQENIETTEISRIDQLVFCFKSYWA